MGGHSITGRARTARPDFRLTPKQRKLQRQKVEGNKKASDLRIVTIKKSDRKERTMDIKAMRLKKPKQSGALRKIKALEKKLEQIARLKERQAGGDELDEHQLAKRRAKEPAAAGPPPALPRRAHRTSRVPGSGRAPANCHVDTAVRLRRWPPNRAFTWSLRCGGSRRPRHGRSASTRSGKV